MAQILFFPQLLLQEVVAVVKTQVVIPEVLVVVGDITMELVVQHLQRGKEIKAGMVKRQAVNTPVVAVVAQVRQVLMVLHHQQEMEALVYRQA
jgi:hypothetical protein